jgi:hypothetical protein
MLCGVHLGVSHQAVLDRVCRQAGFSRMSLSCQASWANLGQKLGRGVGRYAWDNAAVCTSRSSVAMAGAGGRVQTDPQQKGGVQRFVVGQAWDALNDGDLMHFGDAGQLERSTAGFQQLPKKR